MRFTFKELVAIEATAVYCYEAGSKNGNYGVILIAAGFHGHVDKKKKEPY